MLRRTPTLARDREAGLSPAGKIDVNCSWFVPATASPTWPETTVADVRIIIIPAANFQSGEVAGQSVRRGLREGSHRLLLPVGRGAKSGGFRTVLVTSTGGTGRVSRFPGVGLRKTLTFRETFANREG